MPTPIVVSEVSKSFTMHLRDGILLPVVANVSFSIRAGECAVLGGPSGAGKSSILKMLYGNYSTDAGQIIVRHGEQLVDLASASPRTVLQIRRDTIGYVSQFLRTVPRVSALDVVAEPLVTLGSEKEAARERARELLARLNLPERLWALPPATFSGGEQQRVNIARGFITPHPVLLLDEPTASLDARNRDVVVDMIARKKSRGGRAARDIPRCRRPRGGGRQDHRRDRFRAGKDRCMTKLSETPVVHETAEVSGSTLGRYTEIGDRTRFIDSSLGDYSYIVQDCGVWCAEIGKFANIAAAVRINATNHPTWRPTLHHFHLPRLRLLGRRRARDRILRLAAVQRSENRPRHLARSWFDNSARGDGRRRRSSRSRRGRFKRCRALHDRWRRACQADPRAFRPQDG